MLNKILNVPLPRLIPIKQKFIRTEIHDIPGEVIRLYRTSSQRTVVKHGDRIAIAVGSRGIFGIDQIIRALIIELKDQGASPFIIPAMGSHGGATAEGQIEVLAGLGITEAIMGVPIVSSLDVVEVGKTIRGTPVFVDKEAVNSDGLIVINRIKPHTGFKGALESGLCKMMMIGLGNQKGANQAHQLGFGIFPVLLQEVAQIVMANTPFLFGLGIVENGYDRPAILEFMDQETLVAREIELLSVAKTLLPHFYFDDIDVLIVQEMGKEISGPGIDPNVTGRSPSPFFKRELITAPNINKIVVLSLTEKSHGNATGMGIADVTTQRLFDSINFTSTYANTITAGILNASKIPIIMPSDYYAVQVALNACLGVQHPNSKVVWIKNTLQLEQIYVSEAYLPVMEGNPNLKVQGDPFEFPFTKDGGLLLERYYKKLRR